MSSTPKTTVIVTVCPPVQEPARKTSTATGNGNRRKIRNCCRQFVAFLFSQVGLASMVVAYSILGGFLFQALESGAEAVIVKRMAGVRIDEVEKIVNVFRAELGRGHRQGANSSTVVSRHHINWNNVNSSVDKLLVIYQRRIVQAVKDDGWDGRDELELAPTQWSFAGSLLFAVTVTTTIGYGHIAPRTNWGRFSTMVYALVGIPLTFLYLSTIGNFLAQCFRVFYRRICCDVCCCRRCERVRRQRHIERQLLKNSAAIALVQASPEPRPGPAPPGRRTKLSPPPPDWSKSGKDTVVGTWRNRLSVAASAGLTRAESLPDYIGALKEMEAQASAAVASAGGRREINRVDQCPARVTRCETMTNSVAVQSRRSSPATAAAAYKSGGRIVRHSSLLSASRTRNLSPTPAAGTGAATRSVSRDAVEKSPRPIWNKSGGLFTSAMNLLTRRQEKSRPFVEVPSNDDAEKLLTGTAVIAANARPDEKNLPQLPASQDCPTDCRAASYQCTAKTFEPQRANGSKLRRSASDRRSDRRKIGCNDRESGNIHQRREIKPLRPGDRNSGRSSNSLAEQKLLTTLNRTNTAANLLEVTSDVRKSATISAETREKRAASKNNNALGADRRPRSSISTTAVFNFEPIDGDVNQSTAKKKLDLDNRLNTAVSEVVTVSDNVSLGSADDVSSIDSFVTAFELLLLDIDLENEIKERRAADAENKTQSNAGDRRRKFANSRASSNIGDYQMTTNVNEKAANVRRKLPRGSSASGGGSSNIRFANFHSIDDDISCKNADAIGQVTAQVGDHQASSGKSGGSGTSVRHDNTKVRVPILICLVVIVSYILAGSVLFMFWENWDLLKSSYFCFITLTTIGFGDVVPGTATESWSTSHEKLVLCALWLALGLSLLAMCFNLMQEEVKEKCKTLAKKCGLIAPDDS